LPFFGDGDSGQCLDLCGGCSDVREDLGGAGGAAEQFEAGPYLLGETERLTLAGLAPTARGDRRHGVHGVGDEECRSVQIIRGDLGAQIEEREQSGDTAYLLIAAGGERLQVV